MFSIFRFTYKWDSINQNNFTFVLVITLLRIIANKIVVTKTLFKHISIRMYIFIMYDIIYNN